MLGCRSAVFVLNLYAKMRQRYSRAAVSRDVQDGVGTLQNVGQPHAVAQFRQVRQHEIISTIVRLQERRAGTEVQHHRQMLEASRTYGQRSLDF